MTEHPRPAAMRRTARLLRRALAALGTLLLLAAAGAGGLVWMSLPGGGLTDDIPGLAAPVTVTLDADLIPRVRAANELDAVAALGFLHARERMFQMDLMRRVASGELAELFGREVLPLDRFIRTLGLRRRALADLPLLPADTRAVLDAYARGVNAWIALRGRFAAPEFIVFGTPRPWTPVDSLLWGETMAFYLSTNWRTERARLLLDAKMPPAAADELWPPVNSAGHPEAALTFPPALTPTLSRSAGEGAIRKPFFSLSRAAGEGRGEPFFSLSRAAGEGRGEGGGCEGGGADGLGHLAAQLARAIPDFPAPFTLPDSASNAWAVDGRHSATGAPLLAGDPHLSLVFPSLWYLARLEWPGAVRVGATAPGTPFLVLGHNGHIAWSFTTTGADTEDLFVETPVDATHYQGPDGPLPYTLREEHIRVRGGPDETLLVRETRHGPVISDLIDPREPVLALASASLAPGDTAATGLRALDMAEDVDAAGRAAALISTPVQNLIVADHSRIALFVTGRIPIRRAGDGARPVPGATGAYDWTGFANGAQLPHIVAPASGRLVNANERVAPPDFPVFLARDWFDDWRAQRIRALLDRNTPHSTTDFAAMQTDVVDLAARDLLPHLAGIEVPDGPARAALGLLHGWDGAAERDAPQPLIFVAWMQRFDTMLLARLGVPAEAEAAAAPWPQLVAYALSPAGAHWCGGDCRPLLAESLSAAAADLVRRFGPDPAAWRWGVPHQAVFAHPVLRMLPMLGTLAEARIATPGDDETIDRGGVAAGSFADVHGPEFRGVYDLADLDRSLFVLAPGQSGNPFTHGARNFLARWRDGASVMIPPQPAQVVARITLAPGQP